MVVPVPLLFGSVLLAGAGVGLGLGFKLFRRGEDPQQAIRESDLHLLAETMPARVGLTGRWMQVSLGLADLWEESVEGLTGQLLEAGLAERDKAVWHEHFGQLIQAGPGATLALDLWVKGKSRPRLRSVHLVVSHMGPEPGQLPHLRILARENSESKETEKSLLESEAKFRTLTENINCGVFLYRDVFIHVNHGLCLLTGFSEAELVGMPITGVVHPDQKEEIRLRAEARRRGEFVPPRYSFRIVTKEGRTRWVDFTSGTVSLGGEVLGLGTAFDITEQVEAQEQQVALERRLLEAQRMESLGVMASGIAHDFNNLLTGILGNASILSEEAAEGDLTQQCAANILEACRKGADLTRQMLDYTGRARFVVDAQDLSDTIRGLSTLLEATLPRRIRLELDLAEEMPALEADPAQLRQVILNLVTNAAEAIGEGPGVIRIRSFSGTLTPEEASAYCGSVSLRPGPGVFLEVTDDGPGMDDLTRERMFEPFFTTKPWSRGLGLAALQGIVRAHGGGIRVSSRPGEGATIRVVFPALVAPGRGVTALG